MNEKTEPYHHVRFRWWTRLELEKVFAGLGDEFDVKMMSMPGTKYEMAIHKDDRSELEVKSDTLIALLSSFRAVLSQREPAPFTPRDMELRKRVIKLYPRERPTPFPWEFSHEPNFVIAN
jgi:hypothetical protein